MILHSIEEPVPAHEYIYVLYRMGRHIFPLVEGDVNDQNMDVTIQYYYNKNIRIGTRY